MQPRINVVTLGTKDLDRTRKFYEQGLGWKASSATNDMIAVYQLGGLVMCIYPEHLLAEDAQTTSNKESGFGGITLAHNVSSKEEVETVLKKAVAAGAKLQKPAQEVFWGGYSGYFTDPDGHFWEVAWNPFWSLQSDGTVQVPK